MTITRTIMIMRMIIAKRILTTQRKAVCVIILAHISKKTNKNNNVIAAIAIMIRIMKSS